MKTLFKSLFVIAVVFFFLGVLPIVFPPSALVIYPILTILGIYWGWLVSKNGCSGNDD